MVAINGTGIVVLIILGTIIAGGWIFAIVDRRQLRKQGMI